MWRIGVATICHLVVMVQSMAVATYAVSQAMRILGTTLTLTLNPTRSMIS
jgi:hypothetical protein